MKSTIRKKIIIIMIFIVGFMSLSFTQYVQDEFIITLWNAPVLNHADQLRRDGFNLYNYHRISSQSDLAYDIQEFDKAYNEGLKVLLSAHIDASVRVEDYADTVMSVIENQETNYWETITNHPAYAGFLIKDEPAIYDLDRWRAAYELYKSKDASPNHLALINFFPIQASNYLLCENEIANQVDCYLNYLENYMCCLNLEVLCYDYYRFGTSAYAENEGYFDNLEITRSKAIEHDKPLWVFLQGTQFDTTWIAPTYKMLCWQAYTAITYGVKGIAWFVYDMGDVNLGCYNVHYADTSIVGDEYSHTRLPAADSVAKINQYIKTIGVEVLKLKSKEVYHIGEQYNLTRPIPRGSPIDISGGNFVVGLFEDENNMQNYFMITNKDYESSQTAVIQLNVGKCTLQRYNISVSDNQNPETIDWEVEASWVNVPMQSDGSYSECLSAGNGTLFRICFDEEAPQRTLLCGTYSSSINNSENPIVGKKISSCSGTTISADADVVIIASDEIIINNNFEVSLGGQFYAFTQPILNFIPRCYENTSVNVPVCISKNDTSSFIKIDVQAVHSTEIIGDNLFILSPNPCKGVVQLNSNLAEKSNLSIQIFNYDGLLIQTLSFQNVANETNSINLSGFKKGIYIIYITTDKYFTSKKIIIE